MISKIRKKLPYRKTCEGYLFYEDKVIAKYVDNIDPSKKGFLKFPGGGIDVGESPEKAMRREAFEETGAVIEENIIYLGKTYFDWDMNWAKTEKQHARYKLFRGEEMHFFRGTVTKFVRPKGDPSDVWKGNKLMELDEAIRLNNTARPYPQDMKKYLEMQLRELRKVK
jgi:8-oxo-dGTP pyrophosphatase MutT (NUDIX family)